MKKIHKYLLVLVPIFIFEVYLAWHIEPDLSAIGEPMEKWTTVAGYRLPLNGVNKATVTMTWIIMATLVGASWLITRRLEYIPGKRQSSLELFVGLWESICVQSLGQRGRKFVPFIGSVFIFVLTANWIGILPSVWKIHAGIERLFHIPEWFQIEEPTRDLNTTLGLGIICFVTAQLCGIRYKGTKNYFRELTQPFIFMLPINVVGEFGKLISHSFRLFGNIMGGAVILIVGTGILFEFIKPTVVGMICAPGIVIPLGMNIFFGLFIGLVQAFVFAMLAITYIAVLIAEE
jgi:F-type H+-transporting ATPase subunit a